MHSLLRSKRAAMATTVGLGLALSLGMVPGADAVGSASPAAPIKVIQNSAETVSPGMVLSPLMAASTPNTTDETLNPWAALCAPLRSKRR